MVTSPTVLIQLSLLFYATKYKMSTIKLKILILIKLKILILNKNLEIFYALPVNVRYKSTAFSIIITAAIKMPKNLTSPLFTKTPIKSSRFAITNI